MVRSYVGEKGIGLATNVALPMLFGGRGLFWVGWFGMGGDDLSVGS